MGLLEFQEITTKHIIEYYKDHSVYLLVDETGLGKTHIASEVMKRLADKKNSFNVVYIASSLELAKKNASEKLKVDNCKIMTTDRLSMIWKVLEANGTSDKIKIFPITPEVSLKQNTGGTQQERSDCQEKYYELLNTKRTETQKTGQLNVKIQLLAKVIVSMNKALKADDNPTFKELEDLYDEASHTARKVTYFPEAMKGVSYKNIELKLNSVDADFEDTALLLLDMFLNYGMYYYGDTAKNLSAQYPEFILLLKQCFDVNGFLKQNWEIKFNKDTVDFGDVLEYFFPSSHSSVYRFNEIIEKVFPHINKDKYINEIDKKGNEKFKTAVERLQRNIYYEQYQKYIRTYMSYYSLELLQPDLVIIDEIQNYPEIFEENAKDMDERSAVIKLVIDTILGREKTGDKAPKVLMLSATPYAYRNAVKPEEDKDEEDELGEFTKHLVGLDTILNYMSKTNGKVDSSTAIVELWKDCQKTMTDIAEKLAPGTPNEDTDSQLKYLSGKLKELSEEMKNIGISRTERPIHSYAPNEGKLTVDIGSIDVSEFNAFFKKDNSAVKTRLALSLPRDIDPKDISSAYSSLKDAVNNTQGEAESSRIRALADDMFEGNSYLWLFVPPNKPSGELTSGELKGVFADWLSTDKNRYWSKTLLFSAYSVVPEILSECIERELDKRLEEYYKGSLPYEEAFEKIKVPECGDVFSSFDEIEEAKGAESLLKEYFSSDHAKKVLLAIYGDEILNDYWACVKEYCIDGCFGSVLEEFKYMRKQTKSKISLKNHLSCNIAQMKKYCITFNGKKQNAGLNELIDSFNSPFYPFAFFLTSVAEEGYDFHWYSDRIVHWNAPSTPIALMQREGRVDRINCMAVRKTIAEQTADDLTDWNGMINNFKANNEGKCSIYKGMFPNFWAGDDARQINRYCYYYPYSSDHYRWNILIRNLEYYRSMFGAADNVTINASEVISSDKWKELKNMHIDLSLHEQ